MPGFGVDEGKTDFRESRRKSRLFLKKNHITKVDIYIMKSRSKQLLPLKMVKYCEENHLDFAAHKKN